ncbi:MAG: hypothetical protein K0B02_03855 [DPANN group archaeon]|nr:hypothetical protein [DPANN group archaeon]
MTIINELLENIETKDSDIQELVNDYKHTTIGDFLERMYIYPNDLGINQNIIKNLNNKIVQYVKEAAETYSTFSDQKKAHYLAIGDIKMGIIPKKTK